MPFIWISEQFKGIHIVSITVTVTGDNINKLNVGWRINTCADVKMSVPVQ